MKFEDVAKLPMPEVNAGITEDGKGFITFFGNTPVYRSFEYDPLYDSMYMINLALKKAGEKPILPADHPAYEE